MNTADFDELSESEKRHFHKCRGGEVVDKRQLDDVLFHATDNKPRPDIQYGGSVRIDECTRTLTKCACAATNTASILMSYALPVGGLWDLKVFAADHQCCDARLRRGGQRDRNARARGRVQRGIASGHVPKCCARSSPLMRCRCLILAANGLSFMFSHE